MKRYAVNLIVNTKNSELYDQVAISKFPIVIQCPTEAELKETLKSPSTIDYIKDKIKNKKLFDSAQWYIRSIYQDGSVHEIIWNVKELTEDIFN